MLHRLEDRSERKRKLRPGRQTVSLPRYNFMGSDLCGKGSPRYHISERHIEADEGEP
jgi:hypothetical protein